MYPLSGLKFSESRIGDTNKAAGEEMLQDTKKQRGAFVEVKGWGDVLEGSSRRKLQSRLTGCNPDQANK